MAAFVLVHGTGDGGWCRRFVVPLLRPAGHDVYAPTLTGLDSSSHLLHDPDPISLDTRVKGVTNTLFYDDLLEVVLIDHSYRGMVITEVAAREPRRLTGSTGLPRCLPASRGEKQIVLWLPDQKERYLLLP